jgi:hypothetical protein
MAKNKNDDLRQARAIRGLDLATGVIMVQTSTTDDGVPAVPKDEEQSGDTEAEVQIGKSGGDSATGVTGSLSSFNLSGEGISLVSTFADLPEERPWDYIYDSKSKELLAVVNPSSLIYREVKDEEFLGVLALAEAVIGFLINERSYKYDAAREIRDQWLSQALESRVK